MIRILFAYIVPFLLPTAVYAAWLWYRARYVETHEGKAPGLEKGPWPLTLFMGAVLVLISLGATALLGGGSAKEHYVPPYVEDGKMIPGHLEPRKPQ